MCSLRLLKMILLVSVTVGCVADTSAFGALRFGVRNNRNQRTGRSSRPNPLSEAVANVQRALSVLNAARAEQVSAQRNLVQTRSKVNAKYDNSKTIAQVNSGFEETEAAHDNAKEKVLVSLKKNDAAYKGAVAKLTAIEEQLKKAQATGSESQVADLKTQAREQRLAVSSLEGKAFKNDSEVQAAQRLHDEARRRIQALRKETEVAIAKDSEMNNAKAKTVQASRKVNAAQAGYTRAVASANATAQAASAQAMHSRYGRGRHHSFSRFRRYR
jgi:chromosome segregation ATPase